MSELRCALRHLHGLDARVEGGFEGTRAVGLEGSFCFSSTPLMVLRILDLKARNFDPQMTVIGGKL